MKRSLFHIILVLFLFGCETETDRGLNSAAYDGNIEKVILLLENGADVNGKGWDGDTPLANAIRSEHPEIVELLLSKGADTRNEFVQEAIAGCENQEIVELLKKEK